MVSERRNFLLAGWLKKRFSTVTVVPRVLPAGSMVSILPPVITIFQASSPVEVSIVILETLAMLGRASPRNPRVCMSLRSVAEAILLVAWR